MAVENTETPIETLDEDEDGIILRRREPSTLASSPPRYRLHEYQNTWHTWDLSAEDIRYLRRSLGLSQIAFSSLLGVSPRTIQAWEQGSRKPLPALLLSIAELGNREGVPRSYLPPDHRPNGKGPDYRIPIPANHPGAVLLSHTLSYMQKDMGLHMVDIATVSGIPRATLARWELGHSPGNRNPVEVLLAILHGVFLGPHTLYHKWVPFRKGQGFLQNKRAATPYQKVLAEVLERIVPKSEQEYGQEQDWENIPDLPWDESKEEGAYVPSSFSPEELPVAEEGGSSPSSPPSPTENPETIPEEPAGDNALFQTTPLRWKGLRKLE